METRVDVRTGLEELDREECLRLLEHQPLGRLAVVVAGQPLIFPVNFAVDGNSVVLRTDHGSKLYGARHGRAAFECDGIDRRYHTGWSVVIHGVAEAVENEVDVARLERMPLRTWSPGPKPVWLRLRANSITGRRIPPPGRTRTRENEEHR
jgi:nitroimidazol reductase NimA-like FMN-containing flavoprotein (pyridoxamine 5'-phosphate oxidase superfamily)